MIAIVEAFFRERGFGFAGHTSEEGIRTNIFFHIKDVMQGNPVPGAQIQCDLEKNQKGFVAKNIKVVPPQKSEVRS